MERTLIIGAGNHYRRDDAAGLLVAARLKARACDSFEVIEQSGEGAALMEAWKQADRAIIIDAVCSGGEPGTIYRWDARADTIPRNSFQRSTHAFGIAEAIEMARALGELPSHLIVYGIEGETFDIGIGVSPKIEAAADETLELILGEEAVKRLF